MATFAAIFPPAGAAVKLSVNASASSAKQTLGGTKFLFAINADQDITIKFGYDAAGVTAATTDFRIPAGVVATWDTGQYDSFAVFNQGASSANVYIQPLSRS